MIFIKLKFQFILILISNIVDVFLSYGNYYIINNDDVFNANLLASNVTDPAVLEQLQQEYRQHTTFFLDILEKSTTVRYRKSRTMGLSVVC